MALQTGDLFLVNRKIGGDWKSFKYDYSALKEDLSNEISNDINILAGYVDTINKVVNETQFTAVKSGNVPVRKYNEIEKFIFHESIQTAKVAEGEVVQVFNNTASPNTSAIYKATAQGGFETIGTTKFAVVEVQFQEESVADSQFVDNDEISVRSIGGGGGEIIIDINPPADPDPGTLWYNSNNGITYIYYVNEGDTDGQWVDVRPGGGGGGGDADLSNYIIRQCDEPDGAALGLENGTIWIKVCDDPITGDPICPNEMYLWCDIGDGTGGNWETIEGGGSLAQPIPPLTIINPPVGGSGTETDPFIIPDADCFKRGDTYSSNTITLGGLTPGAIVTFTDENSVANSGNFQQPIGTVNADGDYSFRMKFQDFVYLGNTSYSAKIRTGEVYFTWTVNVLDKGIETPTILEILDISGGMMPAPSSPAFATGSSVSNAMPVESITGLSDGETSALTATGGAGTGLQFKVMISGGEVDSVEITNGGSGYNWMDVVTVDLSGFGGSATAEFYAYTSPVSGPLLTIQATEYVSDNAGDFELVEWEFSDDPSMGSPAQSTSTSEPTNTGTIANGKTYHTNNGDVYYFRIRYKSVDGIYSAWSNIVRTATGPYLLFRYKLIGMISGKAFDSGDIKLSRIPYTYVSVSMNMFEDGTEGQYGMKNVIGARPGNGNCFRDGHCSTPDINTAGSAGKPLRCAIVMQYRQPVRMIIERVDVDGSVLMMSQHPDDMHKIGVTDFTQANSPSAPTTSVTGSGSGLLVHMQRTSEGYAKFVGWDSGVGSGYAEGDIVQWADTIGKGNYRNKDLDSVNDVIIHGMPGRGGNGVPNAGYCADYGNGIIVNGSDSCSNGNKIPCLKPVPNFSDPYSRDGQTARRGEHCTGGEQNAGPGGGGGVGWTGGGFGHSNGTNRQGAPGGTGGQLVNPMVTDGTTYNSATFDGVQLFYNFGGDVFKHVKPASTTEPLGESTFDYIRIL